jgi:hypothetical protein
MPKAKYGSCRFGRLAGLFPRILSQPRRGSAALEEFSEKFYTTNAVEGFHRMLRKFTKTKNGFSD